jgi:serine/threonine-protein kinase
MSKSSSTLIPASAPPLSAGRTLGGKFEIVGVLGEGGTGIVYDAKRIAPTPAEARVALKVIHPHLAGDRQIRGRFQREASILRRLEGKHLCPLLDFGELPDPRREGAGLFYMELPRVDGESLEALLKREKILPLARAVAIVRQVCVALQEAHAQGVIHRDLKPGNALLRTGDFVFVVDFGMAKIITGGGGTGTTGLTQHNMVFGTPEYMAPEQAKGDELDARCDVYAAGIMLYELLTGAVPFTGATPLNVLTAHLTLPPRPPREVAPERGISAALEAVVMHAIAKDPAERYPTATALEAAIAKAWASPDDADAVAPSKRVVIVDESDADVHALTIPAPEPARTVSTVRPPKEAPREGRGWMLIWFAAAVIGISIGVWLSLR